MRRKEITLIWNIFQSTEIALARVRKLSCKFDVNLREEKKKNDGRNLLGVVNKSVHFVLTFDCGFTLHHILKRK